ncbi:MULTISPECIES: sugar kinase [unclassified Lactococcus]|uniref:sugar kinase n=1 Tax=unclassified Lactococcus TaxID=2643510 RepID=UPI0011CC23B8|nr:MULTISPECIES: sugar kinase [unclassified Lactococcus]MQW22992.1 sugar kinase [Lactococcus sp. dk101]TXK44338.1 sugar kinase [Lactococcus sp. dk310]TXK50147.1 sugar kinase [Lactococcus sp. dk322]
MAEIITIGEPLVVFASNNLNQNLVNSTEFSKVMGGAELNVMIGASRLGHSTEYISQVGDDPFGQFVVKEIAHQGVGNRYISKDMQHWTGFYLKEFVNAGDPETFYFRKGSAAAYMNKSSIDDIDFSEVKWAHLSGIFPAISLQARETFSYLVEQLLTRGIHTTFDPNLRPSLWESEDTMRQTINELAKAGEIVMPGIEEGEILVGTRSPEKIADFYLNQSDITQTVIVKLGASGAFVKLKTGQSYTVPGFRVEKVVDTVGAGDGFALGVLTGLIEGMDLKEAVTRGCAIGALAVMAPGDNDGYPTRKQLNAFYDEN